MPRDLRNLPAAVMARLASVTEEPIAGVDLVTTYRGREFRLEERRRPIELRLTDTGDPILEGYASATGVWYDVWGGPPWGWREMIQPGAFEPAIARGDDTRLLVNHDNLPMARTRSGTLTLAEDGIGLRVETPNGVDIDSPAVRTLVSAMSRGTELHRDVDEMSFAFTVDVDGEGHRMEDWNEDYTERTIRGVVLYDVSVVTYPANPATMAQIRDADQTSDATPGKRRMPLQLSKAYAESSRL